jgi:hypothetical protein
LAWDDLFSAIYLEKKSAWGGEVGGGVGEGQIKVKCVPWELLEPLPCHTEGKLEILAAGK